MKSCVIYFSRSGNTKRAAEAIANALSVSVFDLAAFSSSSIEEYDLLLLGTPVEGFKPAKETLTFVDGMPSVQGKNVILFCTYRLYKGSVFKSLEKALTSKGYNCIAQVSKKGMKPDEPADFTGLIDEIKKALPK